MNFRRWHALLFVVAGFPRRFRANVFGITNLPWQGAAGFFGAGEIPEIGEIAALLRFDGLHGAVAVFEKNAFAIRFFREGEAAPVLRQSGKLLDEIEFAQAAKFRQARDFHLRQAHLSGPATAGRAPLTFEENRHNRKRNLNVRHGQAQPAVWTQSGIC